MRIGKSCKRERAALLFFLVLAELVFVTLAAIFYENTNGRVELSRSTFAEDTVFEGVAPELLEILDELRDILPEEISTDPEQLVAQVGVENLASAIISGLSGGGGRVAELFATVVGLSLIFAVAETVMEGMPQLGAAAEVGIRTVLVIPVFSALYGLTESVSCGVRSASELFGSLIPLMSAVLSAGGLSATAITQESGMSITLGVVSGLVADLLLPLVGAMFLLSAISAVSSNAPSAAAGLRGLFTFVMGGGATVLVGTVSLQTVITSAADSVTLRGVKYALSNMIPAVGSVVSGSLSALTSGVGVVSGVMGGASAMAMCSIFALPVIELILYRLALKVGTFILELLGASFGKRTLGAFICALDALITVTVCCGVIYILEIVLFLKHGLGVM